MSSLPTVGESLDPGSTLEAQARRSQKVAPICSSCKLPSYPRGYCRNLRLCWTCCFTSTAVSRVPEGARNQTAGEPK